MLSKRRIVILIPAAAVVVVAGAYIAIRFAMRGPLAGETSHDFGIVEVYPGETAQLTHTFHLTNPRNEPITIRAVRPECGCVRPVKGLFTIQSGDSIDLPIIMDFKGGDKTVLIHLDLDEAGWQVLKVHAQAKFLPRLYAHAQSIELSREHSATIAIMADVYETEIPPALPAIQAPEGVIATFEGWHSTWKPKDNRSAPCQWEGQVVLQQTGDHVESGSTIIVEAKPMRPLVIPLGSDR